MATFKQYVRAAYPVIWINTAEPERVQRDLLREVVSIEGKDHIQHFRWDALTGMAPLLLAEDIRGYAMAKANAANPVQAVTQSASHSGSVCFLWNFHRYIGNTEVIQAIQNAISDLKKTQACLVILAPDQDKLPVELARIVVTIDFPLPTRDQMRDLLTKSITGLGMEGLPEYSEDAVLDAAMGLTESEAEDAFALSWGTKRALDNQTISQVKAGALLRQAKVSISTFPNRFAQLGGLDTLKKFALATAHSPMSRGVILIGVPGTGKSTWAKALGNELGIPTLTLDINRMLQGLVGSSEANMRGALAAIDAMGHCVVFIDEMEKGLAGVGSSGELDSGVKAGVGATFLKWLSDRPTGKAYLVATVNSVKAFHSNPEYLRAGRWDAMFFLDFPTRIEKDVIWSIWGKAYLGEAPGDNHPDDEGWTGAEIESCCQKAAMMNCSLTEASEFVVPIGRSMKEQINEMQAWARERCIPASKQEVPQAQAQARYRKVS